MNKKELEERDKIIDLLERKGLINIEGDEEGIALRLNSDNEGWCGENILDIFKEGMNFTFSIKKK